MTERHVKKFPLLCESLDKLFSVTSLKLERDNSQFVLENTIFLFTSFLVAADQQIYCLDW